MGAVSKIRDLDVADLGTKHREKHESTWEPQKAWPLHSSSSSSSYGRDLLMNVLVHERKQAETRAQSASDDAAQAKLMASSVLASLESLMNYVAEQRTADEKIAAVQRERLEALTAGLSDDDGDDGPALDGSVLDALFDD